jgi:adenylylsulfate kinase
MNENIFDFNFFITSQQRSKKFNQKPLLIWFTGLSGSGKSTLANALEKQLFYSGFSTYSLDGDNTRIGLNSNLGFSNEDRKENIRRIAEVSKLLLDAGLIVCASFVSPFKEDRERLKRIVGRESIVEIYVSTSLEECEKRDVKGLYQKARFGQISDFTGVSSPYEVPENPFIKIDTTKLSIEDAVKNIYDQIKPKLK